MKTTPVFAGFALSLSLAAASPLNHSTDLKFTWIDPSSPEVINVKKAGEAAIDFVGGHLVYETKKVLAAKSPEDAIDLLHVKSFQLPSPAAGQPVVTQVKRTSLKVRARANTPDNADLAALLSIQRDLMDGNNPPKVLIQHVEATATAPAEWRVYRPIGVVATCVACHGEAAKLAPAVKEKLDRLYPEDQATGYDAQQWRGIIRVSVAPPAATKS